VWEGEYAKAHERWESHKQQVAAAIDADLEAAANGGAAPADAPTTYSSAPVEDAPVSGGTLASDEALAALREKLTSN